MAQDLAPSSKGLSTTGSQAIDLSGSVDLALPSKLIPIFAPPRGSLAYRGAYGGRGSAKSRSFATMAGVFGYMEPLRILCVREFQKSIKESFFAELELAIRACWWLDDHYTIGENFIRGANGTEFIFEGLRRNINTIRSLARIDLTIAEEAEAIPEKGYRVLIPTVRREPKSEVWVIWNPEDDESPTDKRFRKNPPARSAIVEMSWQDNPFFPAELAEEKANDLKILDTNTFAHVWDGAYLEISDRQILSGKWEIEEFDVPRETLEDGTDGGPLWQGPYHGLDFGFAQDPTAAVRLWINNDILYVEYEAGKSKLELDDTGEYVSKRIPGIEDYVIRADSARPESISFLKRNGLPKIASVKKWPNSVQEGVQHLRSYKKIVIHPRCVETAKEFRRYSYEVDALTGDIKPKIVDKHNHYIDAIRYALQRVIRKREFKVA